MMLHAAMRSTTSGIVTHVHVWACAASAASTTLVEEGAYPFPLLCCPDKPRPRVRGSAAWRTTAVLSVLFRSTCFGRPAFEFPIWHTPGESAWSRVAPLAAEQCQ